MRRKIFLTMLVALTASFAVHAESVGLVLSGGGAKGVAHVGVIKALEDNNIPIDYVTGTSMGAIVGGLYCCGYSPAEMMQLITSKDFHYWSTGTIDENLTYFFDKSYPTPQMLQANVSFKDSTQFGMNVLKGSLINPLPMNFEFMRLFSPYTIQCNGDFNKLFVPFRCVCSDVYHKHKVVMGSGPVDNAIRASMSFPLVFKPIERDGVLVYDGGIYDNFPVDVMHDDFNPDIMIGVSVSGPDGKPIPGDMYEQLEDMIIQNNDYSLPADEGIKIQVPVLNFGVLDFGKAEEIYEIGYKTGLAMVDSIKQRVTARRSAEEVAARRAAFKRATPVVKFDSIKVEGGTPSQNRFLTYVFENSKQKKDSLLRMNDAKDAYYRIITTGKVSDMFPQAIDGAPDGNSILHIKADVKNNWTAGLGGWLTSSVQSMLYLSVGYHTLSYRALDVDLSGWLGQSYYAGRLGAKIHFKTASPSYLQFEGVLSRQKYYDTELLFYQDKTPSFITERENYIRLNYAWAIGRKAKGYVSFGYADIGDSYYDQMHQDYTNIKKDKSQYHEVALRAGYERNTLDNQVYPSAGMQTLASIAGFWEESRYLRQGELTPNDNFTGHSGVEINATWRQFFPVAKHITIGTMAQGVAVFRKLYQNYMATMIHAPAFGPTPSTANYFNPAFRSDSYLAAGVIPIWKPVGNLQIRGDFYAFAPIRNMVETPPGMAQYNGWFKKCEFLGEVAAVYNFPFASFSIYCNYLSYPARNWNFGISLGLPFQAPRFLRGSI